VPDEIVHVEENKSVVAWDRQPPTYDMSLCPSLLDPDSPLRGRLQGYKQRVLIAFLLT
jgi:hypothetical protein